MSEALTRRTSDWLPASTLITAATTIIVGFVSTIPIVTEAARSLGATPGQTASWSAPTDSCA